MISWKFMKAAELACRNVCQQEEAAVHYGETYNAWDRWVFWWRGFIAGWLGENDCLPVMTRLIPALFMRWRP
jgi:hypothetical protein